MFLLLALLATHVLAQGDGTCTPLPGLATSFLLAVPEGQPREVVAARDVKCFANMTACDGMYCMPEGGTCCNKSTGQYCRAGYWCAGEWCCPDGVETCNAPATCPTGWAACPDGAFCAPVGAPCCPGTTFYCNPGRHCCDTGNGCCDDEEPTSTSSATSMTASDTATASSTVSDPVTSEATMTILPYCALE